MHTDSSINKLLKSLWHHIALRRRRQFRLLLILVILASLAEILGIGAVLPFLAVLTAPEFVYGHPAAQPYIQFFGLSSADQLLLPLTITFGLAVLIAGAMRLLLLWATTRLSFAVGADLSIAIYRHTLYQSYATHISRNSSEIINAIASKSSSVIHNIIVPTLTLISSMVMLVAILVALLSVNPVVALVAFGGFGAIYALIILIARKRLMEESRCIAIESTQVIKSLQEGLGGIRDVLIDGSQATYCQIYRNADLPLRKAQGNSFFIGASPRYAMEAFGMLLIAALAYALAVQPGTISKAIPVLGVLALGAQRLLPVLQQSYAAWTAIRGGQASLQDVLELLEQPLPGYADQPIANPLPFKQQINIKQLSFRYAPQAPWVLKGIDLAIDKGSCVGIIGKTGSGKSTLLDIVMGLLSPTEGELQIDGTSISPTNCRAWQAHIAHVPQSIFLTDNTIAANIAFGTPLAQIDHDRVRKVAEQAQLADLIDTWPERYQTQVGERGVRLSGGQRQRIGIARALYKQADVIIFDEATSALDNETEQAVMQAIEKLANDLTIIIIAHRLTTLKGCTYLVELSNGEIKRAGSYQDIVNQTA